jgi:type I restriction enzyme M protein
LDVASLPVSEFLEETSSITPLHANTSYKLLGVKWWGGGTFIREEKTGRRIKARKLNKVSAGLIIYNRLFAFRGSFAIVPPEHEGGYVSGEFPTFKVREDVGSAQLVAKYIVHCFLSPQFLAHVDKDSTGSTKTSRNRYKSHRFLQMRVPFPKTVPALERVVRLLEMATVLRFEQENVAAELKALTESLARMLPQPPVASDTITPGMIEFFPERTPSSAEPMQAEVLAAPKGKKTKKVAASPKKGNKVPATAKKIKKTKKKAQAKGKSKV